MAIYANLENRLIFSMVVLFSSRLFAQNKSKVLVEALNTNKP